MRSLFDRKVAVAIYTLNTRGVGDWIQDASDDMVWLSLFGMVN